MNISVTSLKVGHIIRPICFVALTFIVSLFVAVDSYADQSQKPQNIWEAANSNWLRERK